MDEMLRSHKFKIAAISVGSFILVLFIFALGVAVGIHKARFSNKFAQNYERNFMGQKGMKGGPMGFFGNFSGREFRNAHGIAGTIISISDNSVIIKDRDERENNISVNDRTFIKRGKDNIKITDLKNDDRVIVMGRPGDSGMIEADLIRVFSNDENQ